MRPEPAPPPMTQLERLVLESGIYFPEGFDATCEAYRQALRAEIAERLREVAKGDPGRALKIATGGGR